MLSSKRNVILLILVLALIAQTLPAQTTTILFKQKFLWASDKNIKISFSNPDGIENPSITSVENSINYYFYYKAIGNWHFGEKDISSKLSHIFIYQNKRKIENRSIVPKLKNNKIDYVVVSFLKNDFSFNEPFQFKNKLATTDSLNIPEKYWPIYRKYKNYYDQGLQLYKEGKLIKSFEKLKPFLDDNTLITQLSFYKYANKLIAKLIPQFTDKHVNQYRMFNMEIMKSANISYNEIITIDSLLASLLCADKLFIEYFNKENKPQLITNLNDLISDARKSQKMCREKYISNFTKKTYSDYQFKLFIDLIVQSLCNIKYITPITILDTLAISPETNFLAINSFFSQQYNHLKKLGWENEFDMFLQLIHENIQSRKMIFDNELMNNLQRLSDSNQEPKPYFNIISAFNHLFSHEYKLFNEELVIAIQRCADLDLLYKLELLQASYFSTIIKSIPNDVLKSLEDGNKLEENGEYDKAKMKYELISKKISDFAPPLFFLGRVYYKNQEYQQAQICFDKAIRENPIYLLPWRYKIQISIQEGNLEEAQTIVNNALKANSIWYIYYLKASILYDLGDYSQALNIAGKKCLGTNKYSFDLFILLGDIFKQMNDFSRAENQYKKAGELDVNNPRYNQRIQEINNLKINNNTN